MGHEHEQDAAVEALIADALAHALMQDLDREQRPSPRLDPASQASADHPALRFLVALADIELGSGVSLQEVLELLAQRAYFEGHVAGHDRATAAMQADPS